LVVGCSILVEGVVRGGKMTLTGSSWGEKLITPKILEGLALGGGFFILFYFSFLFSIIYLFLLFLNKIIKIYIYIYIIV
jgi:hypothetical protein